MNNDKTAQQHPRHNCETGQSDS